MATKQDTLLAKLFAIHGITLSFTGDTMTQDQETYTITGYQHNVWFAPRVVTGRKATVDKAIKMLARVADTASDSQRSCLKNELEANRKLDPRSKEKVSRFLELQDFAIGNDLELDPGGGHRHGFNNWVNITRILGPNDPGY